MARLDWYIRANLKPRHLQLLAALDELRHVGRVAAFLNITQPAVSKALAEIERGVEATLFERGPRGLTPTAAGQCLIRLARSVLHDLDVAHEELRQLRSGVKSSIRVGVLPVAAPVLVPRAVTLFQQQAPEIALALHEATVERLLPMLRENQLDFVVGTLPPSSMAHGLQEQLLHPGEVVVAVCAPHHPLFRKRTVVPSDLEGYELVLPPTRTIFREVVENVLQQLDVPLTTNKIEIGSMQLINTLLAESTAISFYSMHLARHYERLGLLRALPMKMPLVSLPIGSVWLKSAEVASSTRLLLDCLRQVAREVMVPAPH